MPAERLIEDAYYCEGYMFLLTEFGHFFANYGYALRNNDNRDVPIAQIQVGYLPVESPVAPSAPLTRSLPRPRRRPSGNDSRVATR